MAQRHDYKLNSQRTDAAEMQHREEGYPLMRGPRDFGLVGIDQQRRCIAGNGVLVHHDLDHVLQRRQVEHGVEQRVLQYRAQSPRAGLAVERAPGDRFQRGFAHLQLDALHAEHLLELLEQRVLGLGQDLDQRDLVELLQRRDHRQPAHELGNEAVLDQVLGLHLAQHLGDVLAVVARAHLGAEADAALLRARADDLVEPVERAAAHEQDVGGVDLHELLVGVLAPALRRHRRDGALDQLEQRLLHALARDVAGDRGVVGLARDLVDLVNVDDTALRLLDVVVAFLQQLLDDVLDVLADVAGLGEGGGVRHHEGDVEQACQRLREQRLARAGGADQQDVRLGELDVVVLGERLQPLVVVVDRDRQDFLRDILADHVLVEYGADLLGHRQVRLRPLRPVIALGLLADDVVAELDALVADEHRGARNELAHLVLALAAERAVEQFLAADLIGHRLPLSPRNSFYAFGPACQNLVHDTVAERLLAAEEIVAVRVPLDGLQVLPGVLGEDLVQLRLAVQYLPRVYLDVRGLPLEAAQRLVDHHARVRQAEALALGAGREQQRAHAGRLADAQRGDGGLHELHGVVDRQPVRDRSARRVDV